jgi:hypothetical protein
MFWTQISRAGQRIYFYLLMSDIHWSASLSFEFDTYTIASIVLFIRRPDNRYSGSLKKYSQINIVRYSDSSQKIAEANAQY